jgi:hypothetical protein
MKVFSEPVAQAAISSPSMSWWEPRSSRIRSLKDPGSDSSALQTRNLGWSVCLGMNDHLRPAENPAPPRPCRPELFTVSTTSSGDIWVIALRAAA